MNYIHGSHPEEQTRLSFMNELLNEASLREMKLRPGEFVLDMGCGTAIFAREMAAAVGEEGRVLGIERDQNQIAEAVRLAADEEDVRVELRAGDALVPPLRDEEWGSFDVVHARFLLEHLSEPLAAVSVMMRAVRPGGRVVLADDDHSVFRAHPDPPGFAALWQAYMKAFERLGNDPRIGRRLITHLEQAGAVDFRSSCLFFGACAGGALFDVAVDNLIGVLGGAKQSIVAAGDLAADEFDGVITGLGEWRRRPDAAIWYTADWAEGKRPSAP